MIYVRPHYYEKFCCIAENCPATCCAGWQIWIDGKSLEAYENVKGDFGRRLQRSINWREGAFRQEEQRCAFLNNRKRCDIYEILGKEALCETCSQYPRHVEEYDGLRELSLSLSCPRVAELIVGCEEKTVFEILEDEEQDDFEDFDYQMFTKLQDVREVIYEMLQNRKHGLRERMVWTLNLSEEFQHYVERGELFRTEEVLKRYQTANHCKESGFFHKILGKESCYEDRIKEYSMLYSLERLSEEWQEILEDAWVKLYAKGEDRYLRLYEAFQKEWGYRSTYGRKWSIIGEQLLVFFVSTYYNGSVYDDQVYSKMALAVFSVIWIQELTMLRWVQRKDKFSLKDTVEVAYRYAREVEHSDLNLEGMEDWLRNTWHGKGEA